MHNMGIAHGDIHIGKIPVNENRIAKLLEYGCTVTGKFGTLQKRRDRMEFGLIEEMLLSKVKNLEHTQKDLLKIWLM